MSYGGASYGTTELAGRLVGGAVVTPGGAAPEVFTFDLTAEDRGAHTYRQPDPVVPFENRGAKAMPSAVIECTTFVKDPGATKPYSRNWEDILDDGETIVTSTWDGGGLTTSGDYILGDRCYVFLAGGVVNTVYVVGNTILTSEGRTYCREFRIAVELT